MLDLSFFIVREAVNEGTVGVKAEGCCFSVCVWYQNVFASIGSSFVYNLRHPFRAALHALLHCGVWFSFQRRGLRCGRRSRRGRLHQRHLLLHGRGGERRGGAGAGGRVLSGGGGGRLGAPEAAGDLVKGLAPRLRDFDEGEDEEDDEEGGEDEEDPRTAQLLKKEEGETSQNCSGFIIKPSSTWTQDSQNKNRRTDSTRTITPPYLQFGEAHCNQEVGRPVAAAGHSHGRRAGPLGEQLGHDEPRDGTGPQLEHGHEQHDRDDGHVAHNSNVLLL